MATRVNTFGYAGSELDLFARAVNWKNYVRSHVSHYLGNEVLEVGAGFGASTRILAQTTRKRWLCLEPDASLAARLQSAVADGQLPNHCECLVGTLAALPPRDKFDTVLYIDVLEHVDDDFGEVPRATARLRPGGHLIVLCPAHQILFSPFDRAIGHRRRYNKAMFRAFSTRDLALVRLIYLDSVGFLASLANRLLLKRSMPAGRHIDIWDRILVPLSRVVDPVLRYTAGKSLLGVWQLQEKVIAK